MTPKYDDLVSAITERASEIDAIVTAVSYGGSFTVGIVACSDNVDDINRARHRSRSG
jgi:hypothetical protein